MTDSQDKNFSPLSITDTLETLGNKTNFPHKYSPEMLERFRNLNRDAKYSVELICPEFTALCPKTSQPDFGTIIVEYCPNWFLVESKSMKLYLGSFRNEGVFHEDVVNRIAKDLIELLHPIWLEVEGDFASRGGIKIHPTVRYEQTLGESYENDQDPDEIDYDSED